MAHHVISAEQIEHFEAGFRGDLLRPDDAEVALKDEYDPTNVFSLSQNITPSGSARTDGGARQSSGGVSPAVQ